MNKYAIYCSGNASRILKFYAKYDKKNFPSVFVFYDGDNLIVIEKLKVLFNGKVFLFTPNLDLSKSENFKKLSNELLAKLIFFEINFLFCFGNAILKGDILITYKNKIINFHPSLLPSFPGLNAIDQALQSSVQVLGNTAHFIDAGIDTGPIIMQSVIARKLVNNYEDVLVLQIPMMQKIWNLLDEDKINIVNGKVTIDNDYNAVEKTTLFSL